MKKRQGIHFYINIENFNDVVEKEEANCGELNHSIHALDTFFTSIERYGQRHYKNIFNIEKITGARLHMFVVADIEEAYQVVRSVSVYAYILSEYMCQEIGKYRSLPKFEIQVGADYRRFYEYNFYSEHLEEMTTIGYTANYAAKLQVLAQNGYLNISEAIFKELPAEDVRKFELINSFEIKKYDQEYYYTVKLSNIKLKYFLEKELERAKKYANDINLTDMKHSEVQQAISFRNLSKKNYKKLYGIPLYADIRGFTKMFESDDCNLEEMTSKTTGILSAMYKSVITHNGVHIQFQGDRELALFHDYPDHSCIKDAVLTGLRIIDAVRPFAVSVGVGQSIGELYAAKVGARGEKDNILLGRIVNESDRFEDQFANENQLVISNEIYNYLYQKEPSIAAIFKKKTDKCYFTEVGYKGLIYSCEKKQQIGSTKAKSYNGAWKRTIH